MEIGGILLCHKLSFMAGWQSDLCEIFGQEINVMNDVFEPQDLKRGYWTQVSFLLAVATIFVFGTWRASPAIGQDQAPTVLVTGSSQGYGLHFVQEYAKKGWNVIATCRNPSQASELKEFASQHSNVVIEELDVTDFDEIEALAEKYNDTPIDVLLNNAAINTYHFGTTRFGSIDYDWYEEILRVNVIGPLKVSETFLEHVAASEQKKIVVMSSTGSSITNNTSTRAPLYRTSKAALNASMHILAIEVAERGVIVGIIGPGSIDTEGYLDEDPETLPQDVRSRIESGRILPLDTFGSIVSVIDNLTLEKSGVLLDWNGDVIPW